MDITVYMYDETPIASVMIPFFPPDDLIDEATRAFLVSEDTGDQLTI